MNENLALKEELNLFREEERLDVMLRRFTWIQILLLKLHSWLMLKFMEELFLIASKQMEVPWLSLVPMTTNIMMELTSLIWLKMAFMMIMIHMIILKSKRPTKHWVLKNA